MSSWVGNPGRPPYVIPCGTAGLKKNPVYSNVPGFLTCSRLLDTVFLETNPIHLRRKQFFDARQREGQTIIEFREELLSLIEEADGDNIGVNDLICMMLQIGTQL